MSKLKYIGTSIVFQEVPDEISLSISISGCPYHCDGCHSEYLWKYDGRYLSDDFAMLLEQYDELVTCICFMGGDQELPELISLAAYAKSLHYKVALYTGRDDCDGLEEVLPLLDYIKIGHFDRARGGLEQPTTNQKMMRHNASTSQWDDITHRFIRRHT